MNSRQNSVILTHWSKKSKFFYWRKYCLQHSFLLHRTFQDVTSHLPIESRCSLQPIKTRTPYQFSIPSPVLALLNFIFPKEKQSYPEYQLNQSNSELQLNPSHPQYHPKQYYFENRKTHSFVSLYCPGEGSRLFK